MPSSHLFHLDSTPPQKSRARGFRIDSTQLDFPILEGMACSLLHLETKAMREPHWHPNANELSYCIEGKGLITIFGPEASRDTFSIESGVLSFVPMGSLHYIENIGDIPLKLFICFDNANPEDLDLTSSISAMPEQVLGTTFQITPSFFAGLHTSLDPIFITDKPHTPRLLDSWKSNRFKMDIESTYPQVSTSGGWVKMSNGFLLPALQGLAMYSLQLDKGGVREPHWHPNSHELNYLFQGNARISLLSPGGDVNTFDMKAGDMSFLPRGYLHYIENRGLDPARFAVFFNNIFPSDIGLSGALGAYSNEVLASLFKVPADYLNKLPKYQNDLFVRKNK